METTENIEQAVLDEALVPDLSGDTFEICGKTITVKPLKVRFQIEFNKVLAPFAADVAFELQEVGWLSALTASLKHTEVVPKLIHILCKNDGVELSEDQILDSDKQIPEMLVDLGKFASKNEAIGKPISDFFTHVLPLGKRELEKALKQAAEQIKKVNSTITA